MGKVTGFLFSSLLVLFASFVFAEETSYSDEKCLESIECKYLMNQKPDYFVEGVIEDIIDGDTLSIRMFLIPGLEGVYNIRVRGVDAPEKFKPKCAEEKKFGEEVTLSVSRKFGPGRWVRLSDISYDKYGGRLVARIDRRDSDRLKSLGEELLESTSARWNGHPHGVVDEGYDWCEALKNG
ncbi:thermonuclease family protein [Zhengella sp. ZM62]|uniref:thermonuclease family protein n=1 Tax=Zhengella sedimenti TaxID=3390035 RepID=UPI003975880A